MELTAKFFAFASLILLFSASAGAGEVNEYYRGARAQAMGNAFVGLADDEEAIYYNPAGLAGNKKFEFDLVAANLQFADDIYQAYKQGLSGMKKFDTSSISQAMGKNIYGEATYSPTLLLGNFGISYLVDGQTALYVKDKAYPYITLGYQTTNGIQAGYGLRVWKPRRWKGELRFGIGAKLMWRRGGYSQIQALDVFNASKQMVSQMAGNYREGIGADLGLQYVQPIRSRFKLMGGLAFTNIGDVTFGNGDPDPIRQNFTLGTAAQYDFRFGHVTATYDYRHLLEQTDWRKKNHLGLELAFPVVSLYGGINQVYFTYGAGFDFWLLRLTFYNYTEELGSFVYQNPNKRWGMAITLKLAF